MCGSNDNASNGNGNDNNNIKRDDNTLAINEMIMAIMKAPIM